jgi:hypothetical protein
MLNESIFNNFFNKLDKEEQRRFIEIATKHQPGW